MKIGDIIRKSFSLYLENPLIVAPFFLFGLLNFFALASIKLYLKGALSDFGVTTFRSMLLFKNPAELMSALIFKYAVFTFSVLLLLAIAGSFVSAYTIALARKISAKGKAEFKDGFAMLFRNSLRIFGVKLIISVIILFGAFIMAIPAIILFGTAGIFISMLFLIIYTVAVFALTFFAEQSIVVEKNSSLHSIISSYRLIRKNLESFALLLLFIILIYAAFMAINQSVSAVGKYFLDGAALAFLKNGVYFLLFSIILSPYAVILKTYFFVKNKRQITYS